MGEKDTLIAATVDVQTWPDLTTWVSQDLPPPHVSDTEIPGLVLHNT